LLDQHFVLGLSVVILPMEGVDEFFRGLDLAVLAALPEILAGLDAAQAGSPFAADLELTFTVNDGMAARTAPLEHLLRIGPRLPDELARRIEHALDHQLRFHLERRDH